MERIRIKKIDGCPKKAISPTISIDKHQFLMVCIYLYFFQIVLLIFFKECGKSRLGAPTWIFLFTSPHTCASFSLAAIFRRSHTHSHTEEEVPLLRQQEWDSDFTKRPALLYSNSSMNGSCLGKKTAAENQSVRFYVLHCPTPVKCRELLFRSRIVQ